MQHRGRHTYKKHRQRYGSAIFFLVLLFRYAFFTSYHKAITIILHQEPLDIFTNDLTFFSLYTRPFYPELSNFIDDVDNIIQDYQAGHNAFLTQRESIDNAREFIHENHHTIQQRGFQRYHKLFKLAADSYPHKQTIYTLLGEQQPTNYLAVLQNVGEKRPNGGFFGSFAFANINQAQVTDLGIVDTYFPNFLAPASFVTAPERSLSYLKTPNIGFVAANKFGFTDVDGANIKKLYEKIFNQDYDPQLLAQSSYEPLSDVLLHKYIKGVIFLRTDIFSTIPNFEKTIRERQFLNAAVDIIRGEERANKKEVYLQQVNDYFRNNQFTIIKHLLNNSNIILNQQLINIYLSNIDKSFNQLLEQNGLQTIYTDNNIYARDTNRSFNKADMFIDKHITITQNNTLLIDHNHDIVPVQDLTPGDYTLTIRYHLQIPQHYKDFIHDLQRKHNIELTDREIGILGLGVTYNELRWASNSIVHFPAHRTIQAAQGDIVTTINPPSQNITTNFSQAITYRSEMTAENETNTITIDFTIPQ